MPTSMVGILVIFEHAALKFKAVENTAVDAKKFVWQLRATRWILCIV